MFGTLYEQSDPTKHLVLLRLKSIHRDKKVILHRSYNTVALPMKHGGNLTLNNGIMLFMYRDPRRAREETICTTCSWEGREGAD